VCKWSFLQLWCDRNLERVMRIVQYGTPTNWVTLKMKSSDYICSIKNVMVGNWLCKFTSWKNGRKFISYQSTSVVRIRLFKSSGSCTVHCIIYSNKNFCLQKWHLNFIYELKSEHTCISMYTWYLSAKKGYYVQFFSPGSGSAVHLYILRDHQEDSDSKFCTEFY
jgi:hypothetical protein